MLGIARAGRNLVSGEFATENSIRSGKAFLVIVASDASDNTKKLFANKCAYYRVPLVFYSDKEHIGKALGYEMRTSLSVTDEGLAASIIGKIRDKNIPFIKQEVIDNLDES